jgi:hypothetical protein
MEKHKPERGVRNETVDMKEFTELRNNAWKWRGDGGNTKTETGTKGMKKKTINSKKQTNENQHMPREKSKGSEKML